MRFKPTEPNQNLAVRWLSESDRWELGFYPVLFGVRVRMGLVGAMCCTLDYCAGDDQGFALLLLATVAQILERYPEEIAEGRLYREFPGYRIKPINKDPDCWARLQAMAEGGDEQ